MVYGHHSKFSNRVWSGNEDRSVHFRDTYYGQGANMALPIWAEYMQRVYADSLALGIYPEKFDISKSVDVLLDCGERFKSLKIILILKKNFKQ